MDGVDEDYGDGSPPHEIRFSPIHEESPTPPQPVVRRVASFPQANAESSSDSDDMFAGLSLAQLSRYGNVGPNALADDLALSGLRAVIGDDLQNRPVPPRSSRSQRPRIPTAEAQWRRLTERERNVIRRMLQDIPCNLSHTSELGMMRLFNRFRNSRRRNGGGKKSHKKSHKKRTHRRRH